MPGVLTRKTRTPRGKLVSSSAPTTPSSSFTKLSKLGNTGKESIQTAVPFTARSANIEIVLTSKKRKPQYDEVESTSKKPCQEPEPRPVAPATPVSKKRKSVRFAETQPTASTPSRTATTSSSNRKRKLHSDETSQAGALLERLSLQPSPINKRSKTTVHRRAPHNDFDLPKELLDLLDLHAAFLRTLGMQYAHNGTASPIDLRILYSSVTRTWGKRMVTLDDIQRLIGVLSWNPTKPTSCSCSIAQPTTAAPFSLCDYGRDKICIEFHGDSSSPSPLREPKLNMDFEANLRTLWLSRSNDQPPTIFISTLPKAPIKPGASAALVSAKTQTTLNAFKQSIALKKQQDQEAKAAQAQLTTESTTGTGAGAKMTLLDRIRLKETILSQQQHTQNNKPSPADLQRRSALHRAADVAAVIGMLCKAQGQQGRVSFSMAALMVRLKDSVRTPASQEDAAACVRLLAEEVVPGWLRIVKIGGRENVVCETARQPTKAEVEGRVRVLLG
ncbi:hypothetical protein N657DRAFT_648493 [Parathielavia appendiculata]|uniref:DNA replication factor Cdt1 C-terminal domain-containing protein n=1 Tax=Parathielavia appendiculata TaxID=2587402 RepID=A0AAN6TUT2_9PEZI|nr:hypothetical protein N657DRAFT_648493 [Parathielavia appendiculata]